MNPVRYFWLLLLIGAMLNGMACDNVALVGRDSAAPESRRERFDRGEMAGTLERVDTRARQLQLRTRSGRTTTVRYTPDTRVIFNGRELPVSELRRDDDITVQLFRDSRGDESTSLIRLRDRAPTTAERPRQEGTGVQTIEGTVERVDIERGYFEVRPRFGSGTTRVFLPYNPVRRAEDQFRRLREGDYVRVEGEIVTDNRIELKTFL